MIHIKQYVKTHLISLLKKILSRLGVKQQISYRNDKNLNYTNFCALMKSVGFAPKHIIDVGANRGTWTRVFCGQFPKATFQLFEPQEDLQEYSRDLLALDTIHWHSLGVGDEAKVANFSIVDREDSCNFTLSEEEAQASGFEQRSIQVVSLNQFLPTVITEIPDIIKIDAEGWDLEVLHGASNYFGKTELFFVEVGVNCIKVHSAIDIMNFMYSKGYRLFDIVELNRPHSNKNLWLSEMIFVLIDGVLDNLDYSQ
jgi:FkbM family methyltransferase